MLNDLNLCTFILPFRRGNGEVRCHYGFMQLVLQFYLYSDISQFMKNIDQSLKHPQFLTTVRQHFAAITWVYLYLSKPPRMTNHPHFKSQTPIQNTNEPQIPKTVNQFFHLPHPHNSPHHHSHLHWLRTNGNQTVLPTRPQGTNCRISGYSPWSCFCRQRRLGRCVESRDQATLGFLESSRWSNHHLDQHTPWIVDTRPGLGNSVLDHRRSCCGNGFGIYGQGRFA